MAQFARPSLDSTIGTFTSDSGGVVNIYQAIDETSPNDADYIRSAQAPSNAAYVTKLSSITDPLSSTGHIVRYRYQKDIAAGAQINLTVELRQGYVTEVSQGTLIASWSHTDIANGWTTASQTLSGAEADSITNYGDLFLRFVANQP